MKGGEGDTVSPPPNRGAVHTTVTMVWLIYMKNMEERGGDRGQFGNVQESER